MPCIVDTSQEDAEAARERSARFAWMEATLCAVFTYLEDGLETDWLDRVLKHADWKEAGVTRKEVEKWWKEHKAADQDRRAREERERQAELHGKTANEKLMMTGVTSLTKYEAKFLLDDIESNDDEEEEGAKDVRRAFVPMLRAHLKKQLEEGAKALKVLRGASNDWKVGKKLYVSAAGHEWSGKGKAPWWIPTTLEDRVEYLNPMHPDFQAEHIKITSDKFRADWDKTVGLDDKPKPKVKPAKVDRKKEPNAKSKRKPK